MATIAQMLVQSADQGIEQSGANLKAGADLAQTAMNIQNQRAQIEQQKQQLELQKVEKVGSWYEQAAKMPEGAARKAFIKNYIPQGINALGLGDKIHPVAQEMLAAEPLMPAYLKSKIQSGEIKYADALSALSDPEKLASFMDASKLAQFGGQEELKRTVNEFGTALADADKFAASEEGKSYRQKLAADAAMGKQIQGQDAAPEVDRKKKVGELFVAFKAAGGEAGAKSRLAKLREVRAALENGDVKFGTAFKNIPYGANLDVLARIDPKAKALIDTVRSSINVKMRTGDPNPTENQINQIYNQAIDPRLSNDENMKKLDKEIEAESNSYQSAVEQFSADGYMKRSAKKSGGGGGAKFSPNDAQKKQFQGMPPDEQMKALQGLAAKFDVDLSVVKKALGVK